MLDDRSYMRDNPYASRWSVTMILLLVTVGVFVVQAFVEEFTRFPVDRFFYLSAEGLARGFVWQLGTFQFLHGDIWHLLFNCIGLFFLGQALEEVLGPRGFLRLYFGTGVAGGLLQVLFAALFGDRFGGYVLGASAGVYGLLAAYAAMFPDRVVTLLLFFVLPISVRARTILWFSAGIAIFGIVMRFGNGLHSLEAGNIAHAAHLGGMLAGLACVRWIVQGGFSFRWPQFRPRVVRRPRQLVRTAATKPSLWRQPKPPVEEELTPGEFISREVDPILDKISQHGIQSLTDRERQILEKARAKMVKR